MRPAGLLLLCLACCGGPLDAPAPAPHVPAAPASVAGGLSAHFTQWLDDHGYGGYDFARADLTGGSFGGKQSDGDPVVNQPVIFIHGNSDKALGDTPPQTGWSASLAYFLAHGYTPAELYATTWGPADLRLSSQQYHSRAHLTRLRAFIQAVLAYTGAAQVDIVAHSMGVTLGRKAVQGGPASDLLDGGDYDLGPPLTDAVDTFVGIAGSNRGLVLCFTGGPTTPTCGATNGFYPGYLVGLAGPFGVSAILDDLNAHPHVEGAYVYSMWSTVDEVIGSGDLVWGRPTSPIPGQDGELRYHAYPYGHINLKDLTAAEQLRLVSDHSP